MKPSQVLKSLQQEKRNVERSQDLHLIHALRQRLYSSSFCLFPLPHFRIFSLIRNIPNFKNNCEEQVRQRG